MKYSDTGSFTADFHYPWPGLISHPRHPAVVMVHTHTRAVPCCQSHANGKIKWCNAVGYKPRVSPPHYGAACEGCKAVDYEEASNA